MQISRFALIAGSFEERTGNTLVHEITMLGNNGIDLARPRLGRLRNHGYRARDHSFPAGLDPSVSIPQERIYFLLYHFDSPYTNLFATSLIHIYRSVFSFQMVKDFISMGKACCRKARRSVQRKKKTARKTSKTSKTSSGKPPLPQNWSTGTRNRRVTLSWAVRRYLSKLKKAGY